jgi:TolB-like protein/Tfp pilus assembly protein PilF
MSDTSGYQRFFAELKRRKVFRVMAVYGAVGFVLLQVVELLVPALLLPEWTFRFVALLLLVGFPVAIIVAWAFEMTPEGIQRTEDATAGELSEIAAAPASKRWPIGLTAAVATGLFVGAVWMGLRSTGAESSSAASSSGTDAPAQTADSGAGGAAVHSAQAIAVLPFADLTGTDDSRAFALGLHDDLMTQLTQVPDLKVTSRTSVMVYDDVTRPVSEIAQELQVGSIVEGGVRTSGGRVKLNVQLIDPLNDEHLWAETYDQELTAETVFAIQGEIARAVATALRAELSDETGDALGAVLTDNIDAWNAFHQGKLLEDWSNDPEMERRTVEVLERAVEFDPEFVAAWARLTRAQAWLLRRGLATDTLPARHSVDRVIALEPEGAARYYAEGVYRYYAQADYEASLEALQKGRVVQPGDTELMQFEGWVLRRLGRWDPAMEVLDRAIELDPKNAALIWNQGLNNYRLRRYGTARRQYEEALALDPGSRASGAYLTEWQLFAEGNTAAARETLERGVGFEAPGQQESAEYWLAYMERDYSAAIDAALTATGEPAGIANAATARRHHSRPMRLALAYRLADDETAAREWADSAVAMAASELETRPVPAPRDKFGVAAVAHALLGTSLAMRGAPGDAEEAVRHAEEAVRLHGYAVDAADPDLVDWLLIRTYVLVGQYDDAIAHLEETQTRPSGIGLGELELDPLYDPLRDDPRWQALIERAEELTEW